MDRDSVALELVSELTFDVLLSEFFELGVLFLLLLDPQTIESFGKNAGRVLLAVFEHLAQQFHTNFLQS